VSPFLTSSRLKLFLLATGTQISYSRCFIANLCGLSLNLFLPARGGDLVKFAYLREDGRHSWGFLAAVALIERGFDVLALGLLGLTVSLMLELYEAAIATGIVTITASIILLLIPRMGSLPIIGNKAKNFSKIVTRTNKSKLHLLGCFCLCCLCWTANLTIMGLLLNALDETISLTYAFGGTPPSIFAGLVPVSLWGVGTRDGALAYFLQGITTPEIAISAGFLYTALVYWFLGIIGTPFLLFAKRKLKESSLEQE
jgi:glycosyltransferase 2 family protein